MSRYIRTTDNKIHDIQKNNSFLFKVKNKKYDDNENCWLTQDLIDEHYYFLCDYNYSTIFTYKGAIETINELKGHNVDGANDLEIVLIKDFVVGKSDSILDLIQVGDLVKWILGDKVSYIMKVLMYEKDVDYLKKCNLTEIYTKQNDNYILVWDKERGVI